MCVYATTHAAYAVLQALQFEHRDMHRGNVLVKRTKEEFIYFRMNHKEYYIKSYGVKATIVDFTLSRVTQKGILNEQLTAHALTSPVFGLFQCVPFLSSDSRCLSHQDLTHLPWLFKGKGDIQFDVYRDMRNATK